jgi:translation initiation factor IF-2
MSKIRINELARELEVKPNRILDLLPDLGIADKKTHSSSLDDDLANEIRRVLAGGGAGAEEGEEEAVAVETALETVPEEQSAAGPAVEPPPATPAEPERPARSIPHVTRIIAAPPEPQAEETTVEIHKIEEEPPVPEPRVAPQPIRPPLAGGTLRPVVPPLSTKPSMPLRPPVAPTQPVKRPQPAAAPPAAVATPAKPAPPPAARPGQILSGPKQPLPPGLTLRPGDVVRPGAPAASLTPGTPIAPRAPARPVPRQAPPPPPPQLREGGQQTRLAGQPAPRPVVPPRPDLVARLTQTQTRTAMPGQPAARPQRSSPVPGQPIYRGPIRPGQPIVRGPGLPTPGGQRPSRRGMHPTALAPEPAPATPDTRRHPPKAGRPAPREREAEREGKLLQPSRRQQELDNVIAANKDITVSEGITVKELSEKLGIRASLVIARLVGKKVFATINQTLDLKLAEELAKSFGAATSQLSYEEETTVDIDLSQIETDMVRRAPVVTVMGHVDHGKTSLLDAIRLSNVAEREAGGITQHIGAYSVTKNDRKIVFIDTPGHEAFTRMRARGAKVTDIVILVVAADDGVMPQTLEAIDHAKAAGVPIIVAINKIDKPEAQPDRIKQQLSDRGLLAEDWGGDVVMVPVSAKAQQNLDLLLEMILLVADMQDLKANPARPAVCTVLEAQLDRGRGPVATVLVRNGVLRAGDFFICGTVFGKVRALFDDRGGPIKEAEPSTPVEVLGFDTLPDVGDTLQVVTDTAKAKQIVVYREDKAREQALSKGGRVSLETLHQHLREGETKELNLIVKADVGGSAEVLSETLQKLSTDKVKIQVLRTGVGAITESDVLLASASDAIVIGFNVRPERSAVQIAEHESVDIRLHTIIYELTQEIKKAMAGLLEPVIKEVYKGRAEVREAFRITKVGMVAGCMVQDGVIPRNAQLRVLRDNIVIHTGRIEGLRRFKDDVSEVKAGFECGISIANFGDVKPRDIIEAFVTEKVAGEL